MTTSGARLSPLQQKLDRIAMHPGRDWIVAVENVPAWPEPPRFPNPPQTQLWSYENCRGAEVLREALSKREADRGFSTSSEQILVTHGAMHALGLVLRGQVAGGARQAVVQAPVLGSILQLVHDVGLVSHVVPPEDMPGTIQALSPTSRPVVLLNSPNNPTGAILSQDLLDAVATRTDQRGGTIIYDAVYEDFAPSPPRRPSGHSQVVVGSMSKNYGAPGLRVGWIIADPPTIETLAARMEYENIAVGGGNQMTASALVQHGNTDLVDAVATGRRLVAQWLATSSFRDGSLCGPGGTQAWIRLPDPVNAADFDRLLFEECRVVVVDSESYAGVQHRHVRIPTGYEPERLLTVLQSLEFALRRSNEPGRSVDRSLRT